MTEALPGATAPDWRFLPGELDSCHAARSLPRSTMAGTEARPHCLQPLLPDDRSGAGVDSLGVDLPAARQA
jgi:hypothetical protein